MDMFMVPGLLNHDNQAINISGHTARFRVSLPVRTLCICIGNIRKNISLSFELGKIYLSKKNPIWTGNK